MLRVRYPRVSREFGCTPDFREFRRAVGLVSELSLSSSDKSAHGRFFPSHLADSANEGTPRRWSPRMRGTTVLYKLPCVPKMS